MTYSLSEEFEMTKQLRVCLTNMQHRPTRGEIVSVEKNVGEQFFDGIQLSWGGWILLDDTAQLSAQWLTSYDQLENIADRIVHNDLQGYQFNVYVLDDEENEELQVI